MAEQVTGNFLFDAATHRDFLGAILGTGIDRRTIGDILLHGEQGAQVLCIPEMVEHLENTLVQVQGYSLNCQAIVHLEELARLWSSLHSFLSGRAGRADRTKERKNVHK
jgi:RNA-binding protein YlmH